MKATTSAPSASGNEFTPLTITIRQATELSGLSRPMIYKLVAQGKLRLVHVGRRSLIPYPLFQKLLDVRAA